MENLLTSSNVLCLTTLPLLMGSGSRSAVGRQLLPLDEECAYLANLFGPTLEEEMGTLASYARRTLDLLTLGASGHWEDFWSD